MPNHNSGDAFKRRLRILDVIHPPITTRKILDCLGLPTRAPRLHPAKSALPALRTDQMGAIQVTLAGSRPIVKRN